MLKSDTALSPPKYFFSFMSCRISALFSPAAKRSSTDTLLYESAIPDKDIMSDVAVAFGQYFRAVDRKNPPGAEHTAFVMPAKAGIQTGRY
jgi:hypothetical protein